MESTIKSFSSSSVFFNDSKINIVLVDGEIIGYVLLCNSSKVFNKLIIERKSILAQDFGCTPTESYTVNEKGDHTVLLETPTRSYIWGGKRMRSKLEMKKAVQIAGIF